MPDDAMELVDDVVVGEVESVWKKLYDEKRLKRKFINALKSTKNPVSATWSYNSNLQYHNMVFEHKKDKLVFDLDVNLRFYSVSSFYLPSLEVVVN